MHCGVELPLQSGRGRPRKYCSDEHRRDAETERRHEVSRRYQERMRVMFFGDDYQPLDEEMS